VSWPLYNRTPDSISADEIYVVHTILYNYLGFLRDQLPLADAPNLNLRCTDRVFPYANQTAPALTAAAANYVPINFYYAQQDLTNAALPANFATYYSNLSRLLTVYDCEVAFVFSANTQANYTLTGDFVSMLGLDPTLTHTISYNNPLYIKIPIYGHDFIAVQSSLVSGVSATMNGEALASTDLLRIVPTPLKPGLVEEYEAVTTGGALELNCDHIDTVQLSFNDKLGNPIKSMEDFIVTLVIDSVLLQDLPKAEHHSLSDVRNATHEIARQEIRKKLRMGY
jgi:hypothetical protein